MNKLEQRLQQYRAVRLRKHQSDTDPGDIHLSNDTEVESIWTLTFRKLFEFDLLNLLPFRLWHQFYDHSKRLCIFSTIFLYILFQLFTAYYQFGSVFFLFSLFIFMLLTLGKHRPGEVSAYSVFNPGCQRIMGTLTAEQLEKSLMLRNKL